MRYILSLVFLISFSVNAQIIILFDEETGVDTVPSSFNFADVTGAAFESYNTAYVVLTGFDSCYASAGTDSFKVGALGTLDVQTVVISEGDTLYLTLVASDICSTAVTSTLTAGGVSNEWSVTTTVDNTPSQFTIHDSTGAAVSSQIISNAVVPAGFICDAPISVVGGDYRIGALGSITRTAGFIDLGDTVFVVDTSSGSNSTATNVALTIGTIVDTFTVTTVAAAGGGGHVTSGLTYYYNDSTLSAGAVANNEWVDVISSQALTRVDGTPTKTDSGVVFDGNDDLTITTFSSNVDSTLSVEVVCKIVDTTAQQFIGGIRDEGGRQLNIGIYGSGGDIAVYGRANGTAYEFIHHGTTALGWHHLVATFSGTAVPKLYIDNVEKADLGEGTVAIGAASISIGGRNESNNLANGSIVRLLRIYEKVLSAGEIEQNYNSYSVQNALP